MRSSDIYIAKGIVTVVTRSRVHPGYLDSSQLLSQSHEALSLCQKATTDSELQSRACMGKRFCDFGI